MKDFLYWTFVRCWPLGDKCEVNWDAWAALGTLLAVFVALQIANKDKVRRWAETDARAGVAYAKLLVPIQEWTHNINPYSQMLQIDAAACLSDDATAYSTKIPTQVLEAAGDMRDLGPAAEPLLDAIFRMQEADALKADVDKILGQPELAETIWGIEVMDRFAWSFVSACRAARTARGLMQTRLNRVNSKTYWKTRYIDTVIASMERRGMLAPAGRRRWWAPMWLISRLSTWDAWRREVKAFRGH
ncbi:hypothetical protein [Stenotrophomonas chelatiphaga]|uniref:hypothetical protein n=1 Tax=Stenotrophomonas chelatiphaga TaxID=517011 RepID=UPI002896786E|nr:hypothetical protein [Stenotrophomonas chelatiphaga]